MYEEILNQAIFVVFLFSALASVYLARSFGFSALGILSILLALFLLTHGLYHLTESFGIDYLSDVFFEPISAIFILTFGLLLYGKSA